MIAAVAALALVGPQLTRLPNGIPVVVETTGRDLVTIQVLVRADDLSPLELGAAETMVGALFGETENYSLRELRRLAWSIGGAVASDSAGDCLRLQVTTTRNRLRPTAAFISDALRRPVFTEEALTEARQAELRRQAWVDRTPPLRDIRTALANAGIGAANVTALTADQAKAIHAKVVRPDRVAIAVVGDVDVESVATILGSSVGHWQAVDKPSVRSLRSADRSGTTFKTALRTVQGPTVKSGKFAAWATACVAFGEGKLGSLNKNFRLKQSAYILGSYFTFRHDSSYCTFYVSTTGEPPTESIKKSVSTFEPSEAEAARAKAYLAGRYLVGGPTETGRFGAFSIGHETDANRAFWLAWWELKGAGIGKDARFLAEIADLTHSEIAEAARSWRD